MSNIQESGGNGKVEMDINLKDVDDPSDLVVAAASMGVMEYSV